MKDWELLYNSRICSVQEAIKCIQPYQNLFLAAYCSEPQTVVEELVRQRERLKGTTLNVNVAGSPLLYAQEESLPYFRIRTSLSSPGLKKAMRTGDCDYVPMNLSEIPKFIRESEVDVALIQVSPPNKEGYCNLGISVEAIHSLVEKAKFVIAEMNEQMPITYGETWISVNQIDCFVPSSRPLLTIPEGKLSSVEKKIGENVASLIPDGATIQWGIGNIPNSVLYSLMDKKDLGVHSGSITDPVIDLIDSGVITNRKKTVKPNKMVCTLLLGTEKLNQYVDNNPMFELHPVEFTHSGAIISQIDNFHSINSALEVDLAGQVNAESINNHTIAGVGGQMDFIRGAQYSKGGKAIIAFPSTTKDGTKSRIKATVEKVTSVKSEVQFIVTEYGVARLFGKSLKERAQELISIAHPDFREELMYKWKNNVF
ncbi:acetyl-CoA hydrolase/transferase C-terminal domain-containing protein [Neobacillus sp. 114]|uniref:acetyl-CoA hydrolase/transferase family protein n=1 Tax=Neobacillus sp. 114 TaxID=3048535 RepID=UPI0024C3B658|nr:acetyl-CoA hydrolase/transferase C-terminal domain-containing protein [Neobacillus sp. 114]